jgi:base plate protein
MLPKLSVPTYTYTCPSGITVTYRPFLVKEEKLLLMARESNDANTIIEAVGQVVNNCVQSSIPVDLLPMFDIEAIFLQLRARSVGETANLRFQCHQTVMTSGPIPTPRSCDTVSEYTVDLLGITPAFGEGHTKKIALTDSVGLIMKYPPFRFFKKFVNATLGTEEAFRVIETCIESIYDANKIYPAKDTSPLELREFLESLNGRQADQIDNFFNTFPKVRTTIPFKCPACGYTELLEVEGLESFFV